MVRVKRLLLDILKPHQPSVLELGKVLAALGEQQVNLTVLEMDDQTETLQVSITGTDIDFERVQAAIDEFGASLHSIDEVDVEGGPEQS
jgi:hypothetical protein